MPTNKNAQLRYNIIDRCLSNFQRTYTWYSILEEVNAVLNENGYDGIKQRQLKDDVKFMESNDGFGVELAEGLHDGKKRILRYADKNFSIADHPLNQTDVEQLRATLNVLSRYKNRKEFAWLNEFIPRLEQAFDLIWENHKSPISYEENIDLKGLHWIGVLFNLIVKKKVAQIEYQAFNKEPETVFLHPYHLKQFNSRWFLLGYNKKYDSISNYALDRINKVEETGKSIRKNTINWQDYFDEIIGVTKPIDRLPEKIVLRFSEKRIHYVKTKPLHGVTQKPVKSDPEERSIQIEVIPNFELYQKLLSFGADVEVVSPAHIREEMKHKIAMMAKLY